MQGTGRPPRSHRLLRRVAPEHPAPHFSQLRSGEQVPEHNFQSSSRDANEGGLGARATPGLPCRCSACPPRTQGFQSRLSRGSTASRGSVWGEEGPAGGMTRGDRAERQEGT